MRKKRLRRSRNRFGEGEIASEKKESKPDRRNRRGNHRGEEIEEGGGETEANVSH